MCPLFVQKWNISGHIISHLIVTSNHTSSNVQLEPLVPYIHFTSVNKDLLIVLNVLTRYVACYMSS